jgi:hypothetical protein
MYELKLSILTYVHNLGVYDYLAFAGLILIFFILMILAMMLMKKSIKFSMFLLLLSIILLISGPFSIKYYLGKTIRAVNVNNIKFQKLHFSNTLIIDYDIKNLSKKPFKLCEVKTIIYKKPTSKLKLFISKLKPIAVRTILLNKQIKVNQFISKREVFNSFAYDGDINVSIESQCY